MTPLIDICNTFLLVHQHRLHREHSYECSTAHPARWEHFKFNSNNSKPHTNLNKISSSPLFPPPLLHDRNSLFFCGDFQKMKKQLGVPVFFMSWILEAIFLKKKLICERRKGRKEKGVKTQLVDNFLWREKKVRNSDKPSMFLRLKILLQTSQV